MSESDLTEADDLAPDVADAERIDKIITHSGLAPSRTKAHDLICAGVVEIRNRDGQWTIVKGPSQRVRRQSEIRVQQNAITRYVSRGGLKLEGALKHTKMPVSGMRALDVGQSTGGFTDCLLSFGAQSVVGIDVGHGQLHDRLRLDPRVECREGLHINDFKPIAGEEFDLVVCDLSFISLEKVLAKILLAVGVHTQLLLLIKPQFELSRADLDKNGIVIDEEKHRHVRHKMERLCQQYELRIKDYFPSEVKGGDGNQEYFLWACRTYGSHRLHRIGDKIG